MGLMPSALVDNRVRIPIEQLSDEQLRSVRSAFTHNNPAFGGDDPDEPRHIKTWGEDDGWLSFPRGGLARLRALVPGLTVFDRREQGRPMDVRYLRDLREHQKRMVDAMVAKQNCIIRGETGSGKTDAAIAAACRLKRWTLVIVWTKGLMDQWVERLCDPQVCGLRKQDVGIVRGKVRDLKPFTIAMQQSLAAHPLAPEEAALFGNVTADEVQFFAAKTFFASIDPFRAKHRFGISKDETRRDKKEFLIYDLFGDVAEEVTREEVVKKGIVHDVQVAVVPTGFTPGPHYFAAMSSGNTWKIRAVLRNLKEEIASNEERAKLAASLAAREIAKGRTVAILAERKDHCDLLASEVRLAGSAPGFMIGGTENAREFAAAKEGIKRGTLKVVVGTIAAVGTGIDLPAIDRGIVCSAIANNHQIFGQLRGRFCRTSDGKDGARVYYLWDRAIAGMKAITSLCEHNDDVVVLDDGQWVEGNEFLRSHRRSAGNIRRKQ